MQDHQTQSSSDEIDLGVVFEKIRSFFKSVLIGIVQIFQFFWKHKFVLLILFLFGLGLQYVLKSITDTTYVNQYLIKTNYNSTEYVYSKVNAINSKINSNDTFFLKEIFGDHYKRVEEVEVIPVIDVYSLVNKSEQNKETFELLLDEFGDFNFVKEEININEYPSHKLRLFIKGEMFNKELSENLYKSLASNPFYNELKASTIDNLKNQLVENHNIRKQIDSIVKEQKGVVGLSGQGKNSINFSGSQDLQALLNQKRALVVYDLEIREQLSSENEVLKIIDSSFGVYDKDKNFSTLLFSLLFVGVYCFFFLIKFLRAGLIKFIS